MIPPRYLSPEQARRVYDRIGRWQDTQALYENRAVDALVEFARFGEAKAVFEFGCGTGKFAARLLADELPDRCRYLGLDVSPVMVALAGERLRPYGARAEVRQADGSMQIPAGDSAFDRFICIYVLDLLSPDDTRELLREARRVLEPGGLACFASLSAGAAGFPSLVTRAWELVWRRFPRLVGGCRPIETAASLAPSDWAILHDRVVTSFGVPSDVVVAQRRV